MVRSAERGMLRDGLARDGFYALRERAIGLGLMLED
jgi:hypothetical protein